MRLFEWKSYDFGSYQNQLPDFVQYLSQVWQSRNRYNEIEEELDEEEIQERKIAKQRFFDFTYDGKISARNYVGVVQFDNIRLEVYPKIFSENKVYDWKQFQFNLFFWLSYCNKIRFPFSLVNVSNLDFDDFLDVLIFIFANYTLEVLSEQPYQCYQDITEEVSFLKGRLSFPEYINNNLTRGKWQNFYCTHEPFVFDNQFNRIVKYLTKNLLNVSSNPLNITKLENILFLLDDVSDIKCTLLDCEKVKLNPLYGDLENILSLCRLFLSNSVFDIHNEGSKNFCFMLPMEHVFEEFNHGFLSSHFENINIKSQSTDWLATRDENKVFKIRNDLVINDVLIVDTKYKKRIANDGLRGGVSQTDMYQMVSYAIRRKCKDVILLYPFYNGNENSDIEFVVLVGSVNEIIRIKIRSLNITFKSIEEAIQNIKFEFKMALSLN